MITVYKLFPGHLNLNGDSENADVLATRLKWAGIPHQLIEIADEKGLQACNDALEQKPLGSIVVIGHGSKAALKSLEQYSKQIKLLFARILEQGIPAIVVGSGLTLIDRNSATGQRSSRAYTLKLDIQGWPNQALGYVNSDTTDALVRVEQNTILTHLHGPFLAKNHDWATELIRRAGSVLPESKETALAKSHLAKIWEMSHD